MIEQKQQTIAPEVKHYMSGMDKERVIKCGINIDNGIVINALSTGLYSDTVLAVIREYSTNAQDAHVESGYPERPIKVTLPTYEDCNLTIRDYGKKGMTYEFIQDVFANYGESTKRGDGNQNGKWGFGGKAWRSYGDCFQVITYIDGVKTIYDGSYTTENYNGQLAPMGEFETDEENGTEIIIPVRQADIYKFETTAKKFYTFFEPKPILNKTLSIDTPAAKVNGKTKEDGIKWQLCGDLNNNYGNFSSYVVMQNVAYPLDGSQFQNIEDTDTARFLFQKGLVIWMPSDSVEILPSREGLKYDRFTIRNLTSVINEVIKGLKQSIFSAIDNENDSIKAAQRAYTLYLSYGKSYLFSKLIEDYQWMGIKIYSGRKVKYNLDYYEKTELSDLNNIPITKKIATNGEVGLYYLGTMRKRGVGNVRKMYSNSKFELKVELDLISNDNINDIYFCVKDNPAEFQQETFNYFFESQDVFKENRTYVLMFENVASKDECFKKLCLNPDDYTVLYTSAMPKKPRKQREKRQASQSNEKHLAKVFSYNDLRECYDKKDIWEVDTINGEDDEVIYVELDRFSIVRSNGNYNVNEFLNFIKQLVAFGIEIPFIYGIKTSKLAELKTAKVVDETWINFFDYIPTLLKEKLPVFAEAEYERNNFKSDIDSKVEQLYKAAKKLGYNVGGVAQELFDEIEIVLNYEVKATTEVSNNLYDFKLYCRKFNVDFTTTGYIIDYPKITKYMEFYNKYPLFENIYNGYYNHYKFDDSIFQYISLINNIKVDLTKKMG